MPRQRLSSNVLNRLKSRFLGHRYQPLDAIEDEDYVFSLSSSDDSRRTSYESDISSFEQQQVTNDLNNISQNDKKNYYGPAKRITSKNCREKFEIFYEIHSGFTADQVILIENALQIVADRFFKPEILKNMYQICGNSGCLLTHGVLSQSNLIQNSIYFNRYLLLQYQLICLNHQSQNGEISIINIYPVQEKSQSESNNSHPCIFCISHGSTFLIDGEFEIELNQDRLNGSVKNSSNALFWAGEIVYQMLHNLGHRFKDNDCTNRSQIQIFKQCFLHDGNYIPMKTKMC
ncbi:unnamed protein product [Rotaria socialis]|uniref:Uncharacterized protein n=2 Tax=Rotaria socialis TaxID=392032 RepID=A0A819AHK0_9BILA|nr:unnamed protein product [Rotaria socialis]CAF3463685.1 unnamed protein product [Rotaria socialis]CAF3681602.1 unnamed protein product [Rotaria socialis]CAF3777812.1 unnamed protein product [Rotaria socialis]CAF4193010.1 unnamed protein product [Rotaria socialis]